MNDVKNSDTGYAIDQCHYFVWIKYQRYKNYYIYWSELP